MGDDSYNENGDDGCNDSGGDGNSANDGSDGDGCFCDSWRLW